MLPLQAELVGADGRILLQSPMVLVPGGLLLVWLSDGQVTTPSCGSFNPTNVHNGEPGPFIPTVLSGLEASRHCGWQTIRLLLGYALHEQLVCRISYILLMYTVVCEPSFDAFSAVASIVKPF